MLEFPLFNGHPVEYVHNTATGLLPKHNLYFTLQDIVFDEGALISKIAYDTTVIIVELRQAIPAFVLEKEELFDRILQRAGKKDIEFEDDLEFSKRELVSGTDEEATKHFFNKKIRAYILANDSYHIESTGGKLLIFNKTERLSLEEMEQLIQFSIQFIDLVSDRLDLKPSTPEV